MLQSGPGGCRAQTEAPMSASAAARAAGSVAIRVAARDSTPTHRRRPNPARRSGVIANAAAEGAPADEANNPTRTNAGPAAVRFGVRAELDYGEALMVVGGAKELGSWEPEGGFALTWSDGNVWTGELATLTNDAPENSVHSTAVEFKLVVVKPDWGGYSWEDGENRLLDMELVRTGCEVSGAFGGHVKVNAVEGGAAPAAGGSAEPPPPLTHAQKAAERAIANVQEYPSAVVQPAPPAPPPPPPPPPDVPFTENEPSQQTPATEVQAAATPPQPTMTIPKIDLPPPPPPATKEWQGGGPEWKWERDKDHELAMMEAARNRSDGGVNLPEGPAKYIAAGDKEALSWLKKLELIQSILGQNHKITLARLGAASVYLRWISTGALFCAEDGNHHRPNRPAEIARDIFVSIETVAGELYKHGAEVGEGERQMMRQIHPWLPSFSSEFACAEPLTRIRNIAHRSDISEDLKKQIKHTIQNKLHRNAGPDDLVATEAFIKRITVDAHPGECPQEFVDEFMLFYDELRRFFNCSGAIERLDAMYDTFEDETRAQVQELKDAMRALDDGSAGHDGLTGGEGQAIIRALNASVAVRVIFTGGLSTGMRNDAPNEAVSQRQAWRLAEIALEELAFVVLARALQSAGAGVEGEGDEKTSYYANSLNSGDAAMWGCAAACAATGLRHMAMSMWRPMECNAVARELEAWVRYGSPITTQEDALRCRASLQRARRLVEAHTQALIDGFGDMPVGMGRAFGLQEHQGGTFVDAVIRANVSFQLSRLISPMLRAATFAAGSDTAGYDSIVLGGPVVGILQECDRLEPGAVDTMWHKGKVAPVVALVWGADGDEEVSAAGNQVRGVLLARDLPHLSHLAIRARQEQVALATTEDEETRNYAKYLVGQWVFFHVTPEGVILAPASDAQIAEYEAGAARSKPASEPPAAPAPAPAAAAPEPVPEPEEDVKKKGKGKKDKGKGKKDKGKGKGNKGKDAPTTKAPETKVTAQGTVQFSNKLECGPLGDATKETGGAKASVCGELTHFAERPEAGFKAPPGVFVPFGVMETCMRDAGKGDELTSLIAELDAATAPQDPDPAAIEDACKAVRDLIECVPFPADLAAQIAAAMPTNSWVVVRSSANVEDLAGMSAAGLYESVLGVSTSSSAELGSAVQEVWASLYSRRAVLARRAAGLKQADAHMAVLVQEMAPANISFVLHTAAVSGADNTRGADGVAPSRTLEAEIAVGLGETLASGARGTPWRLEVDQTSGEVRTTAFASLGTAIIMHAHAMHMGIQTAAVDYSAQELSTDKEKRDTLGRRLAAVGAALEAEYGAPQDIEGCLVGDEVYIVQSRPQPL